MLSVNASYYDCHSLLFSLLLVKGVRKGFPGEMSTGWGFLGLVGVKIVRKKGMRLLDGGPAGSHARWKHGMEEEPEQAGTEILRRWKMRLERWTVLNISVDVFSLPQIFIVDF